MIPHERSLVRRFAGRPFAIVGVNSDEDKEKVKAGIANEDISWRSFFDGGGAEGRIARAWNVKGWPTTYVIDHEGVIRYKNIEGEELQKAIDGLVNRAEAAQGAQRDQKR